MRDVIFTINAGSSSIKFSVYTNDGLLIEIADGQVSNLGPAATLKLAVKGQEAVTSDIGAADHAIGFKAILKGCGDILDDCRVVGVGHRVVHGGMDFTKPVVIDDAALEKLTLLEPLAPLHQPHNIAGIKGAQTAFPEALQVACFDTAFHRDQAFVNDTFGLPMEYFDKGVRRYGFHGLSYDFMTGYLKKIAPDVADGKIIIAHLGNGASMCAIREGESVASTMGFSALDGLPMGTRCGQIDPGVILYLLENEKMTTEQLNNLLYKNSGLKGMSGISNDVRELEASDDKDAASALDYFVFRIKREIGAMAAVLGGLDAIIFCGGIGENAVNIRARILAHMEWLGIDLDRKANEANEQDIAKGDVRVMVVPTDEERVLARAVVEAL